MTVSGPIGMAGTVILEHESSLRSIASCLSLINGK